MTDYEKKEARTAFSQNEWMSEYMDRLKEAEEINNAPEEPLKYAFGIDVGGTAVKLGLLRTDGTIIEKWEIPTEKADSGAHILPDIAAQIENKIREYDLSKSDILGAGLGVPGPVIEGGIVNKCVNLGWGVFNVEEELGRLTGLKVKAGNDANVAALGEMWLGGGKGSSNVVLVTLGTGVGGGIIINGKILSGADGAAGEIGHFPANNFESEEETCGCGKRGCLEQYCSARGFAHKSEEYLKANSDIKTSLRGKALDSEIITEAALKGDEGAVKCMRIFGEALGRALAAVACVVNPEVFVIGGGMSKAGEVLTDYIRPPFEKYAFHACRNTKFAMARLGNDAGICGCVKMIVDD